MFIKVFEVIDLKIKGKIIKYHFEIFLFTFTFCRDGLKTHDLAACEEPFGIIHELEYTLDEAVFVRVDRIVVIVDHELRVIEIDIQLLDVF
ncbi:hypothetical protein D3C72_2265750 [compost metagenome]